MAKAGDASLEKSRAERISFHCCRLLTVPETTRASDDLSIASRLELTS